MRDNTTLELNNIAMIKTITPDTIKQCCVSDCSFIAGLCISAEFERRFNRRLITSLIHPQDPNTGMPRYNEKGLYIVKLWFNGVERRVLVDDKLPVDKDGKLLCSHTDSNDRCLELWVPILEKAYMKLCGGYDFPGSNSGVDLFSLTGWIPERIYFAEGPNNVKDYETNAERAWERLLNAYEFGDCLATVSTNEKEAEKKGLITGHAYAVLKIFQSSNETRLLQLKNPWASEVIPLTFFCHSSV
jgi:calpain-7